MKKLKAPLLFALALVPVGAVAAYFTILYQLEFMDAAMIAEAVAQFGSESGLIAVYILQIAVYTFVCGFVGHILAGKLGILKPFRFEKKPLLTTLAVSLAGGILFSLDYWTFGAAFPEIQASTAESLTPIVIAASVLYGGIVEELMLRFFIMSIIAFLLWKLFARKAETAPTAVIIAANIIAAVLFAAGHLPATAMLFGSLTPLILVRCFLLNGGFGLLFGRLYRKYGIQYAMVSHAVFHIVSKLIWILFI